MDDSTRQDLLDGLAGGQKEAELARQFGISRERVRQYKVQFFAHLQPMWERKRQENLRLLEPFIKIVGVNRRCRMCGTDLSKQGGVSAYCPPCRGKREAIRYLVSRLRVYQNSGKALVARRALNLAAYLVRKHALTPGEVELYLRGRV